MLRSRYRFLTNATVREGHVRGQSPDTRLASATRVDVVREGAHATKAEVGPFEIQLLAFEPNHNIGAFDVTRPYLVVVLEGEVVKRFGSVRWSLARNSFATMPIGAAHTSDFGRHGTSVLAVRSRDAEGAAFGTLLQRLRPIQFLGRPPRRGGSA